MDTTDRATRILENAIKKFMASNTSVIPVGVLNDILDLLVYTDLDQLPEEDE